MFVLNGVGVKKEISMNYGELYNEIKKYEYIYDSISPIERESEYGVFLKKHISVLKKIREKELVEN